MSGKTITNYIEHTCGDAVSVFVRNLWDGNGWPIVSSILVLTDWNFLCLV